MYVCVCVCVCVCGFVCEQSVTYRYSKSFKKIAGANFPVLDHEELFGFFQGRAMMGRFGKVLGVGQVVIIMERLKSMDTSPFFLLIFSSCIFSR